MQTDQFERINKRCIELGITDLANPVILEFNGVHATAGGFKKAEYIAIGIYQSYVATAEYNINETLREESLEAIADLSMRAANVLVRKLNEQRSKEVTK